MYQVASVEGGRSDFDDKSALEESLVASSAVQQGRMQLVK